MSAYLRDRHIVITGATSGLGLATAEALAARGAELTLVARDARKAGVDIVAASSLAAGHPFAATGGRIVASLAKMLAQKGSGRGLISICAAGGQGVVAILER